MVWTIEAKILPIALIGGHLYIEIWDDSGNRVTQINGFATNSSTGETVTVGDSNDLIRGYIDVPILNSTINFTKDTSTHSGTVLFSGSQSSVMKAIDYAKSAIAYINAQEFPYSTLSIGSEDFNSNSVFTTIVKAMQLAVPISDQSIQDAKNLALSTPGADADMFLGNDWSPNLSDNNIIKGSIVYDTAETNNLIGTPFQDMLYGKSGSDFIDGGAGIDTVSYEGDTIAINYDVKTGIVKQGSDTDTLKNIERVIGTSAKNDTADFKGFTVPSTKFDFSIDIDSSGKYYNSINLKSEKLSISLADIERLEFSDGVQQMEIKPLSNAITVEEIHMGGGNDEVFLSGAPQPYLKIYLEGGDDVLKAAPRGSIVYGGAGADRFELGQDYLIADADATDHITYYGVNLSGGVRWKGQESPWAVGAYGGSIPRLARGSMATCCNAANDNFSFPATQVA